MEREKENQSKIQKQPFAGNDSTSFGETVTDSASQESEMISGGSRQSNPVDPG